MSIENRIARMDEILSHLPASHRVAFACLCCSIVAKQYDTYCRTNACADPLLASDVLVLCKEFIQSGSVTLNTKLEGRLKKAARQLGEIQDVKAVAAQEACFAFLVLLEVFAGNNSSNNVLRIVRLVRDTIDMLIQSQEDFQVSGGDLEGSIESHQMMQQLFHQLEGAIQDFKVSNRSPAELFDEYTSRQ